MILATPARAGRGERPKSPRPAARPLAPISARTAGSHAPAEGALARQANISIRRVGEARGDLAGRVAGGRRNLDAVLGLRGKRVEGDRGRIGNLSDDGIVRDDRLELRRVLQGSGSDGFFGRYNNRDRVYAEVRYDF